MIDGVVDDEKKAGMCHSQSVKSPGGCQCPGRSLSVFVHNVVTVTADAAARRARRRLHGVRRLEKRMMSLRSEITNL